MKRYNPISLSLLLVFLASCTFSPVAGITTPTEEIITPAERIATPTSRYQIVGVNDGGFFSLNPCGPPCFYEIIPGLTTGVEADMIINQNRIFGNCDLIDFTADGGGRGLVCDNGIELSYENDLIVIVGFSPSSEISLQQVIDLYGPPDLVVTMVVSLPDVPSRSRMNIYYNNLQTVLVLDEHDGAKIKIDPTTLIKDIVYYSKDVYQQYRTSAESLGGIPWKGFGTYDATVP